MGTLSSGSSTNRHEGHVRVASFSRLMYLKKYHHTISYHTISYHIYKTPSPYLTPLQIGTSSSRFNLSEALGSQTQHHSPWQRKKLGGRLGELRKENLRHFPLNPGCLIGILILVYELIPISLGRISSPIYPKPTRVVFIAHICLV